MRNVIALLVLAGLAFIQPAMAQSYPTKPIRLIVPFPPGGSADATARPIAEKLSAALGQNIVVENRGGALTVLGAELAAKAAPDGYTLFLMPGAHVLSPRLVRNVPFHPVNDFTPIAMLAYVPFAIFTDPKQPFSTLQDMIAYAKANPGKLSIGITDAVGRLCIESLKSMAKIDVTLINYKGAPALATDVAGSQIHGGVITPPSILGFYKDRRLNVLAITGPKRLALMPNVPAAARIRVHAEELDPPGRLLEAELAATDLAEHEADDLAVLVGDLRAPADDRHADDRHRFDDRLAEVAHHGTGRAEARRDGAQLGEDGVRALGRDLPCAQGPAAPARVGDQESALSVLAGGVDVERPAALFREGLA